MTRLFTTGFELGAINEHNGLFEQKQYMGSVTSSAARSGRYGWHLKLATTGYGYFTQNLPEPSEVFFRTAIRITSMNSDADDIQFLALCYYDNVHVGLNINPRTLVVEAKREGTRLGADGYLFATTNLPLTLGKWYVLEGRLKFTVGITGIFQLKINGALAIDYMGTVAGFGIEPRVSNFRAGIQYSGFFSPSPEFDLDDIAVNDTSGTINNSWPGCGGVRLLKPNGDGASLQWTPSVGPDHYTNVDEGAPPNTTDWITDEVRGHIDLATLEDLPSAVDTINLIEPVCFAATDGYGWNRLRLLVRHSAVNYSMGSRSVLSSHPTYTGLKGDAAEEVLGGTGAWTPAQVNALETGVEVYT